MTVKPPAPPPLPDELDRLLRRLRLPYVRRAAPEVIATATAQRWEHAEVLRVLLAEEAAGRDQATIRCAAARPGCRPARRSTPGNRPPQRSPPQTQHALRTLEWVDRAKCSSSAARRDRQDRTSSKRSATSRSTRADRRLAHARDARCTVSPPPRRRQHQQSDQQADPLDLILIDDVGLLPVSTDAAEALFRVVDAAYEKRSIAICSNIHPSGL